MSQKVRYWASIWGVPPASWGYDSTWTFGETPEAAALEAIASSRRYGTRKFSLPVEVYLKDDAGENVTIMVDSSSVATRHVCQCSFCKADDSERVQSDLHAPTKAKPDC
jgi:hypothetical protein